MFFCPLCPEIPAVVTDLLTSKTYIKKIQKKEGDYHSGLFK